MWLPLLLQLPAWHVARLVTAALRRSSLPVWCSSCTGGFPVCPPRYETIIMSMQVMAAARVLLVGGCTAFL
jgi:hypothetical protein